MAASGNVKGNSIHQTGENILNIKSIDIAQRLNDADCLMQVMKDFQTKMIQVLTFYWKWSKCSSKWITEDLEDFTSEAANAFHQILNWSVDLINLMLSKYYT